jgi:hypothetical protein
MPREGKEETDMRLIIMAAILGANLALTASAALAEGNADPPYVRGLLGISQPARIVGGTGASAFQLKIPLCLHPEFPPVKPSGNSLFVSDL